MEATSTRSAWAAAVTSRRGAVGGREHERRGGRLAQVFPRRVAEVETGNVDALALAAEHGRGCLARERPRFLDLGAAENAPVAGGERLGDRRGGAKDVDDDRERCVYGLGGGEGDMDSHGEYATGNSAMATCYRHPDRETGLSCSVCERPICTDCATFAPVGIRCPEHSGKPQGVERVTQHRSAGAPRRRRRARYASVDRDQHRRLTWPPWRPAAGINSLAAATISHGVLYGPGVAAGDYWRLLTSVFLHTPGYPHRVEHARVSGFSAPRSKSGWGEAASFSSTWRPGWPARQARCL